MKTVRIDLTHEDEDARPAKRAKTENVCAVEPPPRGEVFCFVEGHADYVVRYVLDPDSVTPATLTLIRDEIEKAVERCHDAVSDNEDGFPACQYYEEPLSYLTEAHFKLDVTDCGYGAHVQKRTISAALRALTREERGTWKVLHGPDVPDRMDCTSFALYFVH